MSKVDQLSRNSEEIFDVRKIRSGQKFFLFQSPDTVRKACYLVYENNLVEYVIFGLSNSMSISRGKKGAKDAEIGERDYSVQFVEHHDRQRPESHAGH